MAPYIKQDDRLVLEDSLQEVIYNLRTSNFDSGQLNYTLTRILNAAWAHKTKYDTGNDLIGMLECVKLEFYRRRLAPYEDIKITENGDVPAD